jgi:hypothetical protein
MANEDTPYSGIPTSEDFWLNKYAPRPTNLNVSPYRGADSYTGIGKGYESPLKFGPLGTAAGDDATTAREVGNDISNFSKFTAALPGIGTAVAGLGQLVGAGFQAYAGYEQAQMNEQAYQDNLAMLRQNMAEDTRRYNQEFGLKTSEFGETQRVNTANINLGQRQQSQSEKMGNAQIALAKEQEADVRQQRAIDSQLAALSRIMVFMNSDQSRMQKLAVWKG